MKNVIKIWKFITSHFNGIILLAFLGLFTWAFLSPTYKVSTLVIDNINSSNIKDISNSALLTICLALFQAFIGLLAIGGIIVGFVGFERISSRFYVRVKDDLQVILKEHINEKLDDVILNNLVYDILKSSSAENEKFILKDDIKPKKTTQVKNPEEV